MMMAACLVLLLLLLFLQAPLNSCSSSWQLPGRLLNADDPVEPIRARYEYWIARHGRRYRDGNEKEQRFQVYQSNLQLIDNFNSLGLGFYLIDNKFADLTNDEFRAKISCLGPPPKYNHESTIATEEKPVLNRHQRIMREENCEDGDVPESVDWRKKGAVTNVRNQGQCGACWAFSAGAAMEGINQIKTRELVSLSEQELLHCDTKGENSGCSSGYMSTAFVFVQQNHGLTTDSDYPYQATQETCQTKKLQNHSATISGYKNATANEQNLLQAAASQQVSVAIDAGGFAFQFYSQGVFSGPCGSDLDLGVTLVGYGTDTGVNDKEGNNFWMVKNSWGPDWGEEGYIRMKRGVGNGEGLCGTAKMASYPVK